MKPATGAQRKSSAHPDQQHGYPDNTEYHGIGQHQGD